ncbi:DUF7097 family protein [Haloprofundus halobius]|uniref:DUF7097 family protein n=1 Tax=Haloprofundus halobius TaxID=2876194 RepID=UPI001CCF5A73|nr:hypothetical protein [Haloprofundus halobius]
MEKTPKGTPVGVDDPYELAGRCDHLTGDGRCRYALSHAGNDPEFARARRADDYRCLVGETACEWRDCPHYRSTTDGRECVRCGLPEIRMAHQSSARPLLEEHHLSYHGGGGERSGGRGNDANGDDAEPSHEITVSLCRWCHAKVHKSFARVDDDVNPDAEALAAREQRRSEEQAEFGFRSASERFDRTSDERS